MGARTFLITNDDGIDSPFLAAVVHALLDLAQTVRVVAPSGQRSWISKAMSRRGSMETLARDDLFGCPAWSVDGTPADCVNLGLAHLVDGPIDMVVSGINIGSNAGLPLVLASGTVGGALEGALHGTHALASSLRLKPEDFAEVSASMKRVPDGVSKSLRYAAALTAKLSVEVANQPNNGGFHVHNLNFPPATDADAKLYRTIPAPVQAGSLFSREGANREGFSFAFNIGGEQETPWVTDRDCIDAGKASHSILDFGNLGVIDAKHFDPVEKRIDDT